MDLVATGPIIRRRLVLCLVLFLALFLLEIVQLFRLQILEAESLMIRAKPQWTRGGIIAPRRGSIADRHGHVLALSATAYIASVSPRQVNDAGAFADVLAPILEMDKTVIERRASDKTKGGVILKRQLSMDEAQALRRLIASDRERGQHVLSGLYLEEDAKRYYPMGAFASSLLGLTSIDGAGQSGLELSLDTYLRGASGKLLSEIDGRGNALSHGVNSYIPATDGSTVELTIDYAIQSFAEQAAREAITINGAKTVRILVMNPKTGEILAMCNKPDFDLNEPPRDDVPMLNDLMRNRLVGDAYEPGSTFKILTSAAALESGLVTANERFYCSGAITIDGSKIRCWGNPHGGESFAQALCNSCNPVFVELGQRLGVNRFYGYLEAFGLGQKTGVDIRGESAGILIPERDCKRVDIVRIGFGQSIAVTPLQLLAATGAVVNGGNLMKPYVVKSIKSPSGELLESGRQEIIGNPISESTSRKMRELLRAVVDEGGGKNAKVQGYAVGGKTGTAQLYVDGVVSRDKHIGSFVGFAPIDDPQIAVLVIVDEALKRPDFGSVTAAPFARDILQKSLQYLGIAPETEENEAVAEVIVPDLSGMAIDEAIRVLKDNRLSHVLSGVGSKVIDQMPLAGVHMRAQSLVMLYADGEADSQADARCIVPDVGGMSIAAAGQLIEARGLSMDIVGSGLAVDQSAAPGTQMNPSSKITVTFTPPG